MMELATQAFQPEVAVKAIDKVASATGWVFTRKTPKRIARETLIEEIKKLDISPIEKAALVSQVPKIIKEYSNQNDIVALALEKLSNQAKPEEVNDDWLTSFMDRARLVNSSDLKELWGHVLAEECNEPGKFPKALLRILSDMDSNLAEAFSTLCNHTIQVFDPDDYPHPIVLFDNNKAESNAGLSLNTLMDLDSLGLITFNQSSAFECRLDTPSPYLLYCGHKYSFVGERPSSFYVGQVLFTRFGESLYSIISPTSVPNFIETFKTLNPAIQLHEA